jgi:plasmid stabilization system protein ParE
MASYTIVWSPKARITHYKILEYLERNWTPTEILNFIERTGQVIEHISQNPLHYPYSKESDSYKCVFIPQVSLFYRLKQDHIELLIFWDNRQNPAKLIL